MEGELVELGVILEVSRRTWNDASFPRFGGFKLETVLDVWEPQRPRIACHL